MKYLAIGAAGFLGALARYVISGMTRSLAGSAFPWGTLAVNISGSFLLGLVYAATAQRAIIDRQSCSHLFGNCVGTTRVGE